MLHVCVCVGRPVVTTRDTLKTINANRYKHTRSCLLYDPPRPASPGFQSLSLSRPYDTFSRARASLSLVRWLFVRIEQCQYDRVENTRSSCRTVYAEGDIYSFSHKIIPIFSLLRFILPENVCTRNNGIRLETGIF